METIEMFQTLETDRAPVSKDISIDPNTYTEIARFAREALSGDHEIARVRLRRLLPKLNRAEPQLAAALATAVGTVSVSRGKVFAQAPIDADSRQNLLFTSYPVQLSAVPHFTGAVSDALESVIKEWRCADDLLMAGLAPSRSMLFSGPPGVGKSLAAGFLAKALDLPLLTLDLATVMSSFLGKTGTNLRMVLDYARSFPCVLFLDEFDTIAKRRDDDSDVGELKRLVTVLLQSIDQWPSHSLLIAATNHGELLDPAVWRRFDVTVDFPLPDKEARKEYFKNEGLSDTLAERMASETDTQNYSALRKIILGARKEGVLTRTPYEGVLAARYGVPWEPPMSVVVPIEAMTSNVDDRNREILRRAAANETARSIGRDLGISHTTVVRVLKKLKGESLGETQFVDRER